MATLNPAGGSVKPTPGSSPDKPWFPQPMTPTAPAAAPAADWADNPPHENDSARPAPSDWKQ
jgi:hypothetical protein